jgi:hypothetical protein
MENDEPSAADKSGLFTRKPHNPPKQDNQPPIEDDGLFDPGCRW